MSHFLFILLMLNPGGGDGGSSWQSMIFFIVAIFGVMYFFMIRPQQRKAKEQKNFLESLGKGDKIVTAGGIHGKVLKVSEDTFLIEVDTNTKLKIDKSVISIEMTNAAYGNGEKAEAVTK